LEHRDIITFSVRHQNIAAAPFYRVFVINTSKSIRSANTFPSSASRFLDDRCFLGGSQSSFFLSFR